MIRILLIATLLILAGCSSGEVIDDMPVDDEKEDIEKEPVKGKSNIGQPPAFPEGDDDA